MDDPSRTIEKLNEIETRLGEVFDAVSFLPGIQGRPFLEWEKTLERLRNQEEKNLLSMAVVGPIKSGKSTLTNSLFGGDYLKRGAGVITSIVTRIQPGDHPMAILEFKTWDDVNQEIGDALALVPSFVAARPEKGVDIRLESDRKELARALSQLGADQLIAQDTRSMNAMVLSAFLAGYEKVRDIVGSEPVRRIFEGQDFPLHKEFVGDENLATYLKDVLLSLPGPEEWKDRVEIADCQGSDSPNPLHLVMIEDYLFHVHLILYVVSSRTGLRQADIRFLSLLREMGLLENILFVVNVDISEHENLEDVKNLLARVANEISLIRPEPEVVAVSALYNLLENLGPDMPPRESARMDQWNGEKEFLEFLAIENSRLKALLHKRLLEDQAALVLGNKAGRLQVMATAATDWVRLHRDLLSRDRAQMDKALARLHKEREGLDQIRAMIRDALAGVNRKAQASLGWETDRYFDPAAGEILDGARKFIHQFSPNLEGLENRRFTLAVHAAFQELKIALDRHMAESVNPMVAGFVKRKEDDIARLIEKSGEPYQIMMREAARRFNRILEGMESPGGEREPDPEPLRLNLGEVKRVHGLTMPPLRSALKYSARIRTEAVFRLGAYRAFHAVLKLFAKKRPDADLSSARAIRDAVRRMKEETLHSLAEQFMDFKENLKFQYLYRLLDLGAQALMKDLDERFQGFTSGLEESRGLLDTKDQERKEAGQLLEGLEWDLREVRRKLDAVRRELAGPGPAGPGGEA
ncbi:MAG: dynamin family protein [Pseudomonadota bacterium]